MGYRFNFKKCRSKIEIRTLGVGERCKCKKCKKHQKVPRNAEFFEIQASPEELERKNREEKLDRVFKEEFQSLSIEAIKNSGYLARIGTIKVMSLYSDGFIIKGIGKNVFHGWNEVKSVRYSWNETTTNVFLHEHDFDLNIRFHNALKLDKITENFQPTALYIDLPVRSIKKFLDQLHYLSQMNSFTLIN